VQGKIVFDGAAVDAGTSVKEMDGCGVGVLKDRGKSEYEGARPRIHWVSVAKLLFV
jgi:hypothetical protein